MGTILKYIFYVALILVIYLVAKGIYDGKITEDTTVAQVGSNIADGTQQLVSDTKKAIDERTDKAKAKEAAEKAKAAVDAGRYRLPGTGQVFRRGKSGRHGFGSSGKDGGHRFCRRGKSTGRRSDSRHPAVAFSVVSAIFPQLRPSRGCFLILPSARLQKAFAFASKNSFATMIKTARITNPPELQMPRCFAPKYRRKKLQDKAHPKTGKISGKLCR